MSTSHTRRRLLASSLLLALVTAGSLVVTGAPALARDTVQIPCPSWATVGWSAKPLSVASSSPSFLTSESLIVANNLDTPVTATFTSTTSRTFTVSATAGISIPNLFGFLNVNVSSTITSSTTTAIGVNAQATVPPHQRVIGDYGVDAYDVYFNAYWVIKLHTSPGGCWVWADTMGYEVLHATAPTNTQGWQLRIG
ncbi:hypothetical protein [Virgisporangium aurantiacum]|uniref:Uncharacterized protein n=1 Tax=Virgisporangium aurantiacum TaxID=175570 RepID=A0A8J3ZF38_9ACTN|nr:hypothetical protein [Virgisporangium aurantiacum]GIJ62989.1 hypothetical protein Vau01_105050 [Virgisporangium aurantiacum]